MGVDFEFMTDSNGRPQIYFIDKGRKKVNVGNKLSDFSIERKSIVITGISKKTQYLNYGKI